MTLMIGPSVAPSPVGAGAGAGADSTGSGVSSDAFSGALTQAHRAQVPQRSDRAAERSHASEHSQASEHAHGAEAAQHRSDDDPAAPAAAATDPAVVAGGLLVAGGLTPPPVAPPAAAARADLQGAPVPQPRDAMKIGTGPAAPALPAVPAIPAVPVATPADASAALPVADPTSDAPVDRLHRATPAGPALPATSAKRPAPSLVTPDPGTASPTPPTPTLPTVGTPATPAIPTTGGGAATAAMPVAPIAQIAPGAPIAPTAPTTASARPVDATPVPTDPTAAAASAPFAATLRDVADPAAPRPGKRITIDESSAVVAPAATPARFATATPVADVEAIRPAQAALPEQPLLLGALSKLRDHGNGVHELTVSLHPAELGAVNLTAIVRDGSITVSLAVVDPAARAAVTSALPGLHHDLAQSGFSGVDVSVADHGNGRHTGSGESRPAWSGADAPAPRDDRPDERPAPRRAVLPDRYLDRLL